MPGHEGIAEFMLGFLSPQEVPIDRFLQVVVWVSVVVGGLNCVYPSPLIMVSFSRLCNNVNIFKL